MFVLLVVIVVVAVELEFAFMFIIDKLFRFIVGGGRLGGGSIGGLFSMMVAVETLDVANLDVDSGIISMERPPVVVPLLLLLLVVVLAAAVVVVVVLVDVDGVGEDLLLFIDRHQHHQYHRCCRY